MGERIPYCPPCDGFGVGGRCSQCTGHIEREDGTIIDLSGNVISPSAIMAQALELRDRIARAIAALDAAPDPASDEATKREAHAIASANLLARTILAEGTEPTQRRGG